MGANLVSAFLDEANLSDANLRGAALRNARITHEVNVNMLVCKRGGRYTWHECLV